MRRNMSLGVDATKYVRESGDDSGRRVGCTSTSTAAQQQEA